MEPAVETLAVALLTCHLLKPSSILFLSMAGARAMRSMTAPSSVVNCLGELHRHPIRRSVSHIACIGPKQLAHRIPLVASSFFKIASKDNDSSSSCNLPSHSLVAKAINSGMVANKIGLQQQGSRE